MLINNEWWELRFVSPTSSILRNEDGSYTLGVTIPRWRRIYVSDMLYGTRLKHVISHEIAHAEFVSRGLIVPIYVEEVLCDIIADSIVDTYNLGNYVCKITKRC